MNLLAGGNGPMVDEVAVATPVATPTTIATQSAIISPTPTLQPQGWLTGTIVFWGLVVIVAIATFVYWLKNRK